MTQEDSLRDIRVTFEDLGETGADGQELLRCDVTWKGGGEEHCESRCTALTVSEAGPTLEALTDRLIGRIRSGVTPRRAWEQATWWTAGDLRAWTQGRMSGPEAAQFLVTVDPVGAWGGADSVTAIIGGLSGTLCSEGGRVLISEESRESFLVTLDGPDGTHPDAQAILTGVLNATRREDRAGVATVRPSREAVAVTVQVTFGEQERETLLLFPVDEVRWPPEDQANALGEFGSARDVIEAVGRRTLNGPAAWMKLNTTWTVMPDGRDYSTVADIRAAFEPERTSI